MINKTLKKKKNKIINLYSWWHLGDAIFVMIYLYNCKEYILKNNITVNFYIREENVKQIKQFECCKNVHVLPIKFMEKCSLQKLYGGNIDFIKDFLLDRDLCKTNIPTDAVNTIPYPHMIPNYYLLELNLFKHYNNKKPLNKYFIEYYSKIFSKKIGFPKIKEFIYTDTDLLDRYDKFPLKYQNVDILIINSKPRSNQYDLEGKKKEFNNMIYKLDKKYKVVTTEKLKDIVCTRDDNLSLKDIGAISTHVKYIIAINTGPFTACLNSYALKNVKKWFEFDYNLPFNYGKNFYLNISFDEIIKEIG